jgi:hypothetical protein
MNYTGTSVTYYAQSQLTECIRVARDAETELSLSSRTYDLIMQ